MHQHLIDLLDVWQKRSHDQWVVAVLTQVQGSSYRKPGAMMFFHPFGQTFGMLSGGCLEADLKRHAKKALELNQVVCIEYDASDESDASYQLGCGGIVNIMLLPVCQQNQFLGLDVLYNALTEGHRGFYKLSLATHGSPLNTVRGEYIEADVPLSAKATLISPDSSPVLSIPVRPSIHLGIFGGGLDAIPVMNMAKELGWQVSVFDERSAYARAHDFPNAKIIKSPLTDVDTEVLASLDAAFVMTHNLTLDANALSRLVDVNPKYIALLGPVHRRDKVLTKAKLTLEQFNGIFSAPAGLALGGEFPSSVALSMLSHCHGVLHQSSLGLLDKVMS